MTLKCVADGNPAPTSFNFHLKVRNSGERSERYFSLASVLCYISAVSLRELISCRCSIVSSKGKTVKVENADTYTITDVSRNTSGEYKCSLIDNSTMEASKNITVKCKSANMLHFMKNRDDLSFPTLSYFSDLLHLLL